MKTIQRICSFLIPVVLFCGCGSKDVTLLSQLPVTPILNPAIKVLIVNNSLLNVQMDNDTAIRGLTQNSVFHTGDYFNHFRITPYIQPLGYQHLQIDGLHIAMTSSAFLPTTITCSADYGNTWNLIAPNIPGAASFNDGSWQIAGTQVQDDQHVLLLATQYSYNGFLGLEQYLTMLYRIDVSTSNAGTLLQLPGYAAESLHFTSADTGYLTLDTLLPQNGGGFSNRDCYFSQTTDGGQHWSKPSRIDGSEPFSLVPLGGGHLFVYNGYGHAYVSADDGANWNSVTVEQGINAVCAVSPTIVFALAPDGLIKSTDGGSTWIHLSGLNGTGLFFISGKAGLIYTTTSLYQTLDGGLTWRTLLFPYSYL